MKNCKIKPEITKIVEYGFVAYINQFFRVCDSTYRYKKIFDQKFFVVGGYLASTIKVEVLDDEIKKRYFDPGDYHFWENFDHKQPPNSKKS